jgi:acyl-CoA thioester hydrolase
MEEEGLNLPLVEVNCRYKHPARYDDEITIRTRLAQLRTSLVRFRYEAVRNSDGRLLAEGESVHVVVGRDLKRVHLTKKYWDALHAAAEIVQSAPHAATQSATQPATPSATQSATQS